VNLEFTAKSKQSKSDASSEMQIDDTIFPNLRIPRLVRSTIGNPSRKSIPWHFQITQTLSVCLLQQWKPSTSSSLFATHKVYLILEYERDILVNRQISESPNDSKAHTFAADM